MSEIDAPAARYQLALRSIMTAGENLGTPAFDWCRKNLGITPNEMFGQTEMNNIIGTNHDKWAAQTGSMGRPYPGHRVAVARKSAVWGKGVSERVSLGGCTTI